MSEEIIEQRAVELAQEIVKRALQIALKSKHVDTGWTLSEACEHFQRDKTTILRWVREGSLLKFRYGGQVKYKLNPNQKAN
jgi:transposase